MAEVMYNEKKRFRDESDDSSPEAKRIRDDLLDILDDTEPADANQDLASVMKSFEEEISISIPTSNSISIPVTSDSGESQPDLGYLFGASDDELGLPPAFSGSSVEEAKNESEQQDENDVIGVPSVPVGYEHIWGFEDEIPSYDFGIGDDNSNNGDFLALDGLFDYSDTLYSGQPDYSEFLHRPESLSAL